MKSIFDEVNVLAPDAFKDYRGTIWTVWNKNCPDTNPPIEYTCSKFSKSRKNVLRGLHGDDKTWKLINCVYGKVYFVVVDNRPKSRQYLLWDSWILSDENRIQVLVPPGFANGHLVLSETAVFHYQLAFQGQYNDADDQFTLKWNDNRINIDWPIQNPILSKRDE